MRKVRKRIKNVNRVGEVGGFKERRLGECDEKENNNQGK